MRIVAITVLSAIALLSLSAGVANGQAAPAAPPAPTDKAMYFPNADTQAFWKDLEAKQVINHRVMEGGTFSVNVRIVKPDSPPLVHAKSIDLWIVEAGSATAITGGTLVDAKKQANGGDDTSGTSIKGGTDQPLKVGDMIYVPTGVPHGFKDLKGFRALLIRWEPK
jgi:mannose-6-phosphate isomerase-like protein (cupin superfamily)